jgi:putative tricarboxylic transport membrane protein
VIEYRERSTAMLETLTEALQVVLCRPDVLGLTFLGVILGIILGVLPGIGSVMAMAVLLPLTFGLDPMPPSHS